MDMIRRVLGYMPTRTQPATVESDEVYPLHSNDDTKSLRGLMLSWTARVDDVLDADQLHLALARLLEIGDWRKLGGRLRMRADGKLEIHVPEHFTPERPAVRYSHAAFDVNIDEHALGSQLPKTTATASVQPGPFTFRPFSARADAPSTLEDLLYSDEPQISLHVTSFLDATLVAILWPHTMTGALGLKEMVVAWCRVLAGLEHEVPPLGGARVDVLDAAGADTTDSRETLLMESKELKGFRLLRFGLRFMWDIWRRPNVESCMLCLPAPFVEKLRQRASADLATERKDEVTPFLTDGSIITAWMTSFIANARGSHRPVTLLNAVDVRDRIKADWVPGAAYVQNLALTSYTLLSAVDVAQASLGRLALAIRQDLEQQATDGQLRAMLRRLRAGGRLGEQPIYGEPDSLLVVCTSWTKAKFFDNVDFAPAVRRPAGRDQNIPSGRIVNMQLQTMAESIWARNVFNILGKDRNGTYWVSATLFPDDWARLEAEIASSK